MKRALLAALLAAPFVGGTAAAEAIIVYDTELGERFRIKKAVVETVTEMYGQTAVYDTGQDLPQEFDRALTPGTKLPGEIDTRPVPEALRGKLPLSEMDTRWAAVGDHLVELRPDGSVAMTIYHVLP
jgi:hypothetical protein